MELYLLRHGRSVANERNLVCGCLDFPLAEVGFIQAAQVCEYLKTIPLTGVYCSPLRRALDTIALLGGSVPVRIEPDFAELNTGDYSTMALQELWSFDERYRTPWLSPGLAYPGGEHFEQMVRRVTNRYSRLSSSWTKTDKILIVGHEGTLRSIYSFLFNLSISNYPTFPIGNCDILYFENDGINIKDFRHVKLAEIVKEAL